MTRGGRIRLFGLQLPRVRLFSGKSMEVPYGWGDDSLSGFLDTALRNSFALFERQSGGYPRLAAVDKALERFLQTAPPGFQAFFLPRAHSAWRAAARVGISGQVPETFLLLRGALEWAMYAVYIGSDEDKAKRWLKRQDSDANKKAVRDEFQAGKMRAHLIGVEPNVGRVAGELYEQCIDLGAHPNEMALTSGIRPEAAGTWQVDHLTAENSVALQAALKTAERIGVCILQVCALMYPERFRIVGLSEEMDALNRGL